jgi:xanthine dehydrogenase molybdopterin-binding subunit B
VRCVVSCCMFGWPYLACACAAIAAAGERELRAVQLMFDAGRSINPAVDLGQVRIHLA